MGNAIAANEIPVTAALQKKAIGHYDNLYYYTLDEEQLRRDIAVHEPTAEHDFREGSGSVRVVVACRAAVALPKGMYRDLDTCDGSAHSKLGGSHGGPVVRAYASESERADFRGLAKDDVAGRKAKADVLLAELNTLATRGDVARNCVQNLVDRIQAAVEGYNNRTRKRFVGSMANVSGWTDEDMGDDEATARDVAEILGRQIKELEEQRRKLLARARDHKKQRILQAIDEAEGDFGVPAEWVEEARQGVQGYTPSHTGRVFASIG